MIFCVCLNFISIVEPQWVPVTNESFQSDLCVSPLVTALAPYFTCTFENDVTLSYAEIHKLYNASVSRSISPKGHHQALLTILSTNPTLNNAIITCWVNSAAILQYRLTIISKFPTLSMGIKRIYAHDCTTNYCFPFVQNQARILQ